MNPINNNFNNIQRASNTKSLENFQKLMLEARAQKTNNASSQNVISNLETPQAKPLLKLPNIEEIQKPNDNQQAIRKGMVIDIKV